MTFDLSNTGGARTSSLSASYQSFTSSITTLKAIWEWSVYPNRAINAAKMNITADQLTVEEATVRILNPDDRLVQHSETTIKPGTLAKVDLSKCSDRLSTIQLSRRNIVFQTLLIKYVKSTENRKRQNS